MVNQNVVIVGLGKSGLSAVRYFSEKGARVLAFDGKLKKDPALVREFPKVEFHFGENPTGKEETNLVVMSPGIPLELDFVQQFLLRGIEVTGDIEIAYRNSKGKFIAITGTNGKTTSTTLAGEIFRSAYDKVYVVGNIGNPILDEVELFDENTYVIAELSSFQLESITSYRAHIAAILNITEDHLNRHKTMENYIAAKFKVFENQGPEDYLILNYDDPILKNAPMNIKSQRIYFSRTQSLPKGVFLSEGRIVSTIHGEERILMSQDEIPLLGSHNLENVLACVAIGLLGGVDPSIIRQSVMDFKGVEHRIEFVRKVRGVTYLNDSKATNPDSSIKAVEAVETPIILIAGGMDKQSDFTGLFQAFQGKVKELILLGETRFIIEKKAKEMGFSQITKVENMREAVETAAALAKEGDTVLLSPACASWDMYPNFEVRGKDFKTHVNNILD